MTCIQKIWTQIHNEWSQIQNVWHIFKKCEHRFTIDDHRFKMDDTYIFQKNWTQIHHETNHTIWFNFFLFGWSSQIHIIHTRMIQKLTTDCSVRNPQIWTGPKSWTQTENEVSKKFRTIKWKITTHEWSLMRLVKFNEGFCHYIHTQKINIVLLILMNAG